MALSVRVLFRQRSGCCCAVALQGHQSGQADTEQQGDCGGFGDGGILDRDRGGLFVQQVVVDNTEVVAAGIVCQWAEKGSNEEPRIRVISN